MSWSIVKGVAKINNELFVCCWKGNAMNSNWQFALNERCCSIKLDPTYRTWESIVGSIHNSLLGCGKICSSLMDEISAPFLLRNELFILGRLHSYRYEWIMIRQCIIWCASLLGISPGACYHLSAKFVIIHKTPSSASGEHRIWVWRINESCHASHFESWRSVRKGVSLIPLYIYIYIYFRMLIFLRESRHFFWVVYIYIFRNSLA